jgi:hypothetical protein
MARCKGWQLRDGAYGCIVTIEDLSGQMSQRHALFHIQNGVAFFQESGDNALKAASVRRRKLITPESVCLEW